MDYDYTPVQRDDNEKLNKIHWKYLIKQVLVCMSPWTLYFVTGLYFGSSTVMIPQLRKEANSTDFVSENMAAWLSSVHGYSSIPWAIVLPILAEKYGRKLPYNISCVVAFIGYLTLYFSTHVVYILIAEIILGVLVGANMTMSIVIISEYSSPRYRGVLLTIKSATFFWGVLVANVIGTFFNWRNIMILAFVCLLYNFTSFFWPQSPFWLATQGRFEECVTSHRLLKGTSEESETELKQLIVSQKKYLNNLSNRNKVLSCERLRNFVKILSIKVFYKPVLLSTVLLAMYVLSGKLVCNMYAVQILKIITGAESTAYMGMLILDAVSLLGMYFGCYLSKKINRRTMLFTTSSCSSIFLLFLSLYLYLIKLNYIIENSIVSITLLTIFSISVSCGPMLLSTSIFAELIPLRYKSSALICIVLLNNFTVSTVLRLAPIIFKVAGLHGGFLLYGIAIVICIIILYIYLPETKDKTLIEIEEYFEK